MAGSFVAKKFTLTAQSPMSSDNIKSEATRTDKAGFEFNLTIQVADVDAFIADPSLAANITGSITDFRFHDKLTIEKGYFQLFTRPSASPHYDTAKEMHYTLFLTDREGKKWTFFGYKELKREDSLQFWKQTTTLYFYVWEGHSYFEKYGDKEVQGVGVLRIAVPDFLKQMRSFKTSADSLLKEQEYLMKYYKAFTDRLWEVYAPFIFTTSTNRWKEHEYPLHTTQGVHAGEKSLHPLDTHDGLTISVQRFSAGTSKDVMLLIHGLTSSTDMFIMPEHTNLVNTLHDSGFPDVFCLDWRGSARFAYNLTPHEYNIDDVARYDIPKALQFIREQCGQDVRIHAIAHCVGALSLMASYAAGFSQNLASITCNSVALTPQVPWPAFVKIWAGPDLMETAFDYPYLSPKMPYLPIKGFGKWIYKMERSLRSECKEPACHMLSFIWGWGFPAAFNHRNIHPVTHRRLMDLFGGTNFHFHKHIRKMLLNKESVSWDGKMNYLEEIQKRDLPPTLFVSGSDNQIFPGSNRLSYERLKASRHSDKVEYQEFSQYGHQDIFMGQFSHLEVFPKILAFLRAQAPEAAASTESLQRKPLRLVGDVA
jgi:triacylglycerol lipase/cholesterol oxidase